MAQKGLGNRMEGIGLRLYNTVSKVDTTALLIMKDLNGQCQEFV